ncbi:MAG: hypothetical protein ACI84C_001456 [Flavobacteriales bacterium]|jgi:hypothetical protein
MKFYFRLQLKRMIRLIEWAGINPYLGLALLFVVFSFSSAMIFQRIGFAEYIYPLIGLVLLSVLGRRQRSEFLNNTFTIYGYRRIRVIENLIFAMPFLIVLLIQGHWLPALCFLLGAITMSFFNQGSHMGIALPTPFGRWPFEFISGFRRTWWIFPICYVLAYCALDADNLNLGIFALVATFLPCLNYYSKPEPTFFVWIFQATPSQFLWSKIKIALVCSFLLSVPLMIVLIVFDPSKFYVVLIFEVVGMAYVVASLLGKYAFFPSEINLIQGIVLALSIWFPPLLVVVIPYFFAKSKQNLQSILT